MLGETVDNKKKQHDQSLGQDFNPRFEFSTY